MCACSNRLTQSSGLPGRQRTQPCSSPQLKEPSNAPWAPCPCASSSQPPVRGWFPQRGMPPFDAHCWVEKRAKFLLVLEINLQTPWTSCAGGICLHIFSFRLSSWGCERAGSVGKGRGAAWPAHPKNIDKTLMSPIHFALCSQVVNGLRSPFRLWCV